MASVFSAHAHPPQVDTLSRDAEGKSCLHWAAESLHPSAPNCVQLLCKKQKELIDAQVEIVV